MLRLQDLLRISDYEWEIPASYRQDMRVPVRIFATRDLLEKVMDDKSLEQAVNAATLPGLVGRVLVMPDMHQGYGFPIGGVAATRYPDGVISPGAIGYDINCLAGDTPVLHADGYYRPIADLAADWHAHDLVCFQFDPPSQAHTPAQRWFHQPAHAPVLRLTTASGYSIRATADHPIYTPEGMLPLGELQPGQAVAVTGFSGLPYEPPAADVILDEPAMLQVLARLGKGAAGNAAGQIITQLSSRGLLPLRYDSARLPAAIRLLGFLFGDGTLRFDPRSGKGLLGLYGQAEDLEDLRADLQMLGFSPTRVLQRNRQHAITTTYRQYQFNNQEYSVQVNSSALVAWLHALGAPLGDKTQQAYGLPAWLDAAPAWQRRLFLAALFGAELSSPGAIGGHGANLRAPVLSLNKRAAWLESGQALLDQIETWLADLGIHAGQVAPRQEQVNPDGSRSVRLRLVISSQPENLIRLWSTVGFIYNRKRQALASVAVLYLRAKQRQVAARLGAANHARQLALAGASLTEIVDQLADEPVNQRFIERSLYEPRRTAPRIGSRFPAFEQFKEEATAGLAGSGMVWERIESVTPAAYAGEVYDFTVAHPDHNFVAGGIVVSNCGVRLLSSRIDIDRAAAHLDDLATLLNSHCPSGVGEGGAVRVSDAELDKVCREGAGWALKQGLATEADLRRTEESGCLPGADPSKVSKRARERGRPQLGSLGAGNHFIEVDVVDQIFAPEAAAAMGLYEGCLVVQIHCGSRGFGHQICSDYVQQFQSAVRRYNIQLPDRELVCAPLNSPEGEDYLGAMRAAANYAFTNRQILAHQARKAFEEALAGKVKNWQLFQVYDIAHNMGKLETHEIDGQQVKVCVHRKGATRAFGPGAPGLPPEYQAIGQPVLVPGSMGTASWVLAGTEASMQRSFGSSCHGAGRTMSRHAAKRAVHGAELRDRLESGGIHIRAGSLAGLAEEAPQAYKDVDAVVEAVAGAEIARKVARLRPVAVIKG